MPVVFALGNMLMFGAWQMHAAPVDQFAGIWDCRSSRSVRSVICLNADGTWTDGLESSGRWAVEGSQLAIQFDNHPEWLNRYTIPAQGGVLRGKDVLGGTEAMTRRSTEATTPLVGDWEFFNPDDGKRAKDSLAADGTWSENDHLIGFWQVVGDMLILKYKELGWVDTYDLPPKADVLHGQNRGGIHITLARNGAKPGEAPVKPLPEALMGAWSFSNARDGKRAIHNLSRDGRFTVNGKPTGHWRTMGDLLVLSHEEGEVGGRGWKDTYPLPPDNGILRGANPNGDRLTLARSGVTVPLETAEPRIAFPMATTRAASPAKAVALSDNQFFGKRLPGAVEPVASVAPSASPDAISTPATTPAATPIATPAATPVATPASPPATSLTPVGDWQWHSNVRLTLTDKGAVKLGAKVTGQWKWIDKNKGEIQIQWNMIRVRPPENYQMSPHGNHLTWKNAPDGNTFVEDRVN